jgi:5'(3')-deoxyribonucleotidase
VNILTTPDNGLEIEDKDKVFNFFNQDNIATKITQEDLSNLKDIKSLDIKEIEKKELKKIDKVARDPEFDYMADNNYKTIIGVIGVNAP